MIEALWSVEFESSFGMRGTGVAVFETGRVFGGDASMIYTGRFEIIHGGIDATVTVKKYATVPGIASVVGLDEFTLKLTGTPDRERLVLTGHVVEAPDRKIKITGTRRAELP